MNALLGFYFLDSPLQFMRRVIHLLHSRDEERSVCEEVVHFFKRALGGFWEDGPEEESIGEVADLPLSLAALSG